MDYEKVYRSPINTSIAKNLYSFPKTERFGRTKQSLCRRNFYNVPGNISDGTARTTTFGFGNRSQLKNNYDNPPPGGYQKQATFLDNKIKKRGYSFGNQTKDGFIDQITLKSSRLPGPGKYSTNNHHATAFSMRNKYEDPLEKHKSKLGPGQYNLSSSLNKTGNYFNSRFRGSCCGKFGNTKRFQEDRQLAPGPGKYKDINLINASGNYFHSKFKSNYVKSFQGTSRPELINKTQGPPPGTYYVFSQFGARNNISSNL